MNVGLPLHETWTVRHRLSKLWLTGESPLSDTKLLGTDFYQCIWPL